MYRDPTPTVVLDHDHCSANELDLAITGELRFTPAEHKVVWGKINTCRKCWDDLQTRTDDPQAAWNTMPRLDLSKAPKLE